MACIERATCLFDEIDVPMFMIDIGKVLINELSHDFGAFHITTLDGY